MLKNELTDKQAIALLFICTSILGGRGFLTDSSRKNLVADAAELAKLLLEESL